MKNCLTSLIITEMQIKTTTGYCFPSTRMARIKTKTKQNKKHSCRAKMRFSLPKVLNLREARDLEFFTKSDFIYRQLTKNSFIMLTRTTHARIRWGCASTSQLPRALHGSGPGLDIARGNSGHQGNIHPLNCYTRRPGPLFSPLPAHA